jgi:hypothetical protein
MLLLTILLPAATIISFDKKINIERFLYTPMEVHIESNLQNYCED